MNRLSSNTTITHSYCLVPHGLWWPRREVLDEIRWIGINKSLRSFSTAFNGIYNIPRSPSRRLRCCRGGGGGVGGGEGGVETEHADRRRRRSRRVAEAHGDAMTSFLGLEHQRLTNVLATQLDTYKENASTLKQLQVCMKAASDLWWGNHHFVKSCLLILEKEVIINTNIIQTM